MTTTVKGSVWNTKDNSLPLTLDGFGVIGDGIVDDSTAIQAVFDHASTLLNAKVIFPTDSKFKCDAGLTIDTNKVLVDFCGSTIDFSGMTTGVAITPTQSQVDPNVATYQNHAHPIENGIFEGPSIQTTAVTCVVLEDPTNFIAGIKFNNCGFINFATDVSFQDGSFFTTFTGCNFTQTFGGVAPQFSIVVPTGDNSGERNTFIDCTWNNKAKIFSQSNPNADTGFINCSFDGFTEGLILTQGSATVSGNSHWETNAPTGYFGSVSTGSNTLLDIHASSILLQAPRTAAGSDIFFSDAACITGGIVMSGVKWAPALNPLGSDTVSVKLVGGTGRCVIRDLSPDTGGTKPTLGLGQNSLAYGDFISTDFANDWTLDSSGTGDTPTRTVGEFPPGGSHSMIMPIQVGTGTTSAAFTVDVSPGQYVNGEFWYFLPNPLGSAGYSYAISAHWLDAAGGNLLVGGLPILNFVLIAAPTTQASWKRTLLAISEMAPPGARSFRFKISGSGTVATTAANFYIGDVVIGVS